MGILSKISGRSDREMPFLEHLEELRKVLLASLGGIAVCGLAVYAFSGMVIDWIVVQHVGSAQFIRPMEAFMARIKVSLLLGLIVSLPFVMFQIWNFIVPGLMQHERRIVVPMAFFSTLLFVSGVAFSYLVLTPIMVGLLTTGFSTEHVVANITVDYLLDFIIKLAVACGILFQLPLVVAILTLMDLVSPQFLLGKWRHAVVIILILAAVATPGDGPSQLILAAPIVVLYFLSILLSHFLSRGSEKRRKRRAEEEEAARAEEEARVDAARATRAEADRSAPSDLLTDAGATSKQALPATSPNSLAHSETSSDSVSSPPTPGSSGAPSSSGVPGSSGTPVVPEATSDPERARSVETPSQLDARTVPRRTSSPIHPTETSGQSGEESK